MKSALLHRIAQINGAEPLTESLDPKIKKLIRREAEIVAASIVKSYTGQNGKLFIGTDYLSGVLSGFGERMVEMLSAEFKQGFGL